MPLKKRVCFNSTGMMGKTRMNGLSQTRIVLHIACSTGISQPFFIETLYVTILLPILALITFEICARTYVRTRTHARLFAKFREKILMKEQPHY